MTPLQNNNSDSKQNNSSQNNDDLINDNSQETLDILSFEEDDEPITLQRIHKRHPHSGKKLQVSSSGRIKYVKDRNSGSHRFLHKLKKVLLGLLILIVLIAVGIFATYCIKKHLGEQEVKNANKNAKINTLKDASTDDAGQTVTYKGHKYKYNEDLISVVFMGVDRSTLGSETIGEAGQADAIYIFTYDIKTKKCKIIPVSRETMADVQMYSTENESIGIDKMQLCLAYAYGDGKKTSSENTISSLSKLFYNIPFNSYISMDWDAIGPLTNAVGGVSVNILQDVHTDVSTLNKGETITLTGNDAWSYVKYRDITKLESNNDRLARQKQFLTGYINQLVSAAKKNPAIITDLLDIANKYIYTSLSSNKIVYMASEVLPNISNANDIEFVTISGKTKQGNIYAEFYPDEKKMYEVILNTFYNKIK